MKLLKFKTQEEASKEAARLIKDEINAKSNFVLGLATGSTPEQTYAELIKLNKEGELSFKDVTTYNLDEYIGLEESNPLSYHSYMKEKLFDKIDINQSNTHIPNGNGDVEKNAEDFEKQIEVSGGIDLQILGIGINGHIAFNEPGSSFNGKTGRVKLTDSTIEANSRFFKSKDEVPTEAISMGIGTILKAKKIFLLAFGEAKAEAIRRMFDEEATTDLPASALQSHPDATVIVDEEAAKLLQNK